MRTTFINFFKQNFSNFTKKISPKSLIISPVMMSTYLYYKTTNRNKSSLRQQQNFQKFYLSECQDLKPGEIREVKYGPKDKDNLVVINYEGKFYALSNQCPHYEAPMHQGYLIDGMLKCPWHCAGFDIKTGQTEIAPSLDDLNSYTVHLDEKGHYVELPEDINIIIRRKTPNMSKRDLNDNRKFLIVGGGPASISAAQTLRQSGYTGEIKILSKDDYVPYDRTVLTKFVPNSVEKIFLRKPEFLKEYDIDIINKVEVNKIDNTNKVVYSNNGEKYSYDNLLIATGARPINLNIPGMEKNKVFSLRSYEDVVEITNNAKNSENIVIVGASFVGMELASSLKKSFPNKNIIIVDNNPSPFYLTLGKEIGKALQK